MFVLLVCGGGGGGTLISSYIRRLGSFLEVQNFEFQYFGNFQKNEYFWSMKICGYLFGIITKLYYIFFSYGQGTE